MKTKVDPACKYCNPDNGCDGCDVARAAMEEFNKQRDEEAKDV
jgi:hypothetical protein